MRKQHDMDVDTFAHTHTQICIALLPPSFLVVVGGVNDGVGTVNHGITVTAKRKILAGEELFFDPAIKNLDSSHFMFDMPAAEHYQRVDEVVAELMKLVNDGGDEAKKNTALWTGEWLFREKQAHNVSSLICMHHDVCIVTTQCKQEENKKINPTCFLYLLSFVPRTHVDMLHKLKDEVMVAENEHFHVRTLMPRNLNELIQASVHGTAKFHTIQRTLEWIQANGTIDFFCVVVVLLT